MKKDHLIALMEDIQAKFDFVLEVIVPDIQEMKADIQILKQDVAVLRVDMRAVKADIRQHGHLLNKHDKRLAVVELAQT